jgi:polysaccharide biosynthesis transport protein
MTTSYQTEIAAYINIAKRGKKIIFISILASLIIGSAIAFSISPVYRAQATLFYLQAQIPEAMLISFVNVWLEAAVQFVQSSIFSRDKCTEIIKEVNLYPDLVNKVPADDLVVLMKDHFGSENMYVTTSGAGGTSTQEVMTGVKFYFEDSSPRKAFEVATIIASAYIENYRKFRESFATVTSSFLLDEQYRLKADIAKIDTKLSEYKNEHVHELPELLTYNFRKIEELEQQSRNLDKDAQVLMERKILIEGQLAQIQPTTPLEGISGEKIVTPEEKLATLKTELSVLQTQVSEKHPDIIRVKREIEGLEKAGVTKQKSAPMQNDKEKQLSSRLKRLGPLENLGAYNPAYVNLVTQIDDIDAQLKSVGVQKAEIKVEIEKYKQRFEKTPLIEKEYNVLVRDRDTAQRRYEDLVKQALEADSSAAMEKRDVGGKFVLTEPPAFPFKPIRPDRLLIIGTSLIIGVVAGFLIIFSWEFLNQKIRSPLDVSRVSTLPVLLELPEIRRNASKKINKIRKFAIPVIILIMVPVILFVINYYKPLELDITIIRIIDLIKKQFILFGQ